MPAALLGFLAAGFQGNPVNAIVKLARSIYLTMIGVIGLAWYTAWRNERADPGDITPLIPGLTRKKKKYNPSRDDSELPTSIGDIGPVGASNREGTDRGTTTGSGTSAPLHGPGGKGNLIAIGHYAQRMGLHVGEHPAFGGVSPVHAPNSLHYKGRAIDVSGSGAAMAAFAKYVQDEFGSHITELIHNPGFSIKNGKRVPPSFWGAQVWAGHRNHVHVGI